MRGRSLIPVVVALVGVLGIAPADHAAGYVVRTATAGAAVAWAVGTTPTTTTGGL